MEFGSMIPKAGSPRSGLAIDKPAISVSTPGTLGKLIAVTVKFMVVVEVDVGARSTVCWALPILKVVSVLDVAVEKIRTNGFRAIDSVYTPGRTPIRSPAVALARAAVIVGKGLA